MGWEHYLNPKEKLNETTKAGLIDVLKNHSKFFREYKNDGKVYYEFREEDNRDINKMPSFAVVIEDNKIYLSDYGNADEEIWKILEDYLSEHGGYQIEDLTDGGFFKDSASLFSKD